MAMKLKEIILTIKDFSLNYHNVNSFYDGDIYDNLNGTQQVDYTSVVVTQAPHNFYFQDEYMMLNFNVFYVDRLTSNGDNRLDIQSAACDFFYRLIEFMEDKAMIVQDYQITTFQEKFSDLCAGAYLTFSVRVDLNEC